MGTPAMTTRGFQPSDFSRVADIVDRAVSITVRLDKKAREDAAAKNRKNPGSVKAFLEYLGGVDVSGPGASPEIDTEILALRSEVESWVGTFEQPWIKE
jgi:glycine hydroxymethyltransferase